MKKEVVDGVNYFSTIPTTCDLCGKKTKVFYCKNGKWWDKYVDNDLKICLGCIRKKAGFAEDFEKNTGVSLQLMSHNCTFAT